MNHTPAIQTVSATRPMHVATVARFQIYRQTREGIYATAFKTDSAVEAVGAFLRQSPTFEGGEIRLWDHREQHLSAWAKWTAASTGDAPAALRRENVFQDRLLSILARHFHEQEGVRQDHRHSIAVTI